MNNSIKHVKGHQDSDTTKKLSVEAEINITADKLAGDQSAWESSISTETTSEKIPLLPAAGAILDLQVGSITGHYCTMLHLYQSEAQLKAFIQHKADWSNQTSNRVNWTLLRQHLRRHQNCTVWSAKYIHDLLPTGANCHQYNTAKAAGCSFCNCTKETWHHVLLCK